MNANEDKKTEQKKAGYLGQAWLVLILATCSGAALAGVYVGLNDKILYNRQMETLSAIPKLIPAAGAEESKEVRISGKKVYKALTEGGRHVGWVVPGSGQGFADEIQLLIGLDANARTIKGIYVLAQKETPGLGSNIDQGVSDWPQQFENIPAGKDLTVTKSKPTAPNEIEAVTGATISSRSVCEIVNKTVDRFRSNLKQSNDKGNTNAE